MIIISDRKFGVSVGLFTDGGEKSDRGAGERDISQVRSGDGGGFARWSYTRGYEYSYRSKMPVRIISGIGK